jgi:hypothetical protein
MDKIIISHIEQKRGYTLQLHEKAFIITELKKVDLDIYDNQADAIIILINMLEKRLNQSIEPSINIRDMQIKQLKLDEKGNVNKKITSDTTINELLAYPKILQSIFNPAALIRKTYVMLDRKYQKTSNNKTEFSWFITDSSHVYDPNSTAVTHEQIANVVSIKLYPFRFPHSYNAISGLNRISVEIKELNFQAYVLAYANKRFHFIFDVKSVGSGNSAYDTLDVGQNSATFDFSNPILELNTITVRFGNPDKTITLDPDYLSGVVSIVGSQTVITFTTPHFCIVGDLIYITGFNTDNVEDLTETELVNNENGWSLSAVSTYTQTIDVDISSLVGNILGNVIVHFDSKRFGLRMEISYVL